MGLVAPSICALTRGYHLQIDLFQESDGLDTVGDWWRLVNQSDACGVHEVPWRPRSDTQWRERQTVGTGRQGADMLGIACDSSNLIPEAEVVSPCVSCSGKHVSLHELRGLLTLVVSLFRYDETCSPVLQHLVYNVRRYSNADRRFIGGMLCRCGAGSPLQGF